jgi:hypothetical protein
VRHQLIAASVAHIIQSMAPSTTNSKDD